MIVVHYSEPGSGGVKRHVVDLLLGLDVGCHEYILAYSQCRNDKTYDLELDLVRKRGIRTVEIPTSGRIDPLRDLTSAWKFLKLLLVTKPDIVHLHSSKSGGIGRLVTALAFPSLRVIYVPHAMACFRSRLFMQVERLLAPVHDLLLAVSRSERDDFCRWQIERSHLRTHSIRMGLHCTSNSCHRALMASADFIVTICGRICYQKNALLFFEVALSALKQHSNWHFRWIGDFSDDTEAVKVRSLLDSAGWPAQIEITGWVDDPIPLMREASVFCMFSRYESFGYVTAEAMQLGCAIIATDATGTRDLIVNGVTGVVVRDDSQAILEGLECLEGNRDYRSRLGASAKRLIEENHTCAIMCGDVENIYKQFEQFLRPVIV